MATKKTEDVTIREKLAEMFQGELEDDDEGGVATDEGEEGGEEEEGEEGDEPEIDLSELSTDELLVLRKQAQIQEHVGWFDKMAEATGYPAEEIAKHYFLGVVMEDAAFDRKLWRTKMAGFIDDETYIQACLASGGQIFDEEFAPVDVEALAGRK